MEERQLLISQRLLRYVVEHCLEEKPYEACGILTGRGNRILTAWATENARRSTTAFEVEPSHQVQALNGARKRGESLLAIYHSHPTAVAYPSTSDIRMGIHWPEAARVILSLSGRVTQRAFYIRGNAVREIAFEVDEDVRGEWLDLRQSSRT
ncbi:MAG TPA: M67 family metallopeptidase [Symbiobacteriaceae bacterium]|nr:M67 family metallopeptidase [Symbiobacteriaceae bacterium]